MSNTLPLQYWPAADRHAFDALFAQGGLLDDHGPLGHWRPLSRELMQNQYGRWLGWVSEAQPEALAFSPCERATAERLQYWLAAMDSLAPATRLGHVGAVVRLCRSIAPERSWSAHQAILAGLHRKVQHHGSPRKIGRVLASDILFDAGAQLMRDNDGPITHPDQAVRLRDGAMICLLALMPMRRRALSELALGTSLRVEGAQMTICLDGAMTKNGQYWEAIVPDMVSEKLALYLTNARPVLSARGSGAQTAVWLGRNGDAAHHQPVHAGHQEPDHVPAEGRRHAAPVSGRRSDNAFASVPSIGAHDQTDPRPHIHADRGSALHPSGYDCRRPGARSSIGGA